MTTGYQFALRETTKALREETYGPAPLSPISLPWPPSILSPNARPHWAAKARAFKAYKTACWKELLPHRKTLKGKTRFRVVFIPPDKHKRDLDNCIAAAKAAQDALAIVCGVNDSGFSPAWEIRGTCKGGALLIEVLT